MKSLFSLVFINLIFLSTSIIQKAEYDLGNDFTTTVEGTSSLHNWESKVKSVTGTVFLSFGEDGSIKIQKCHIKVDATSITSTKGAIMDKKTYKALKTDQHPYITFDMTKVATTTKTDEGFTAMVQGKLNIAGVSKDAILDVKGKILQDGRVAFLGEKSLKMTDFNIDPPTALLGTIKTGDEVTIKFRTIFNKN